jgi:hypothetical protein
LKLGIGDGVSCDVKHRHDKWNISQAAVIANKFTNRTTQVADEPMIFKLRCAADLQAGILLAQRSIEPAGSVLGRECA